MQDLEIARGNILRPNGHGGFVIRQSDLSSWAWCPLRKFYEERARRNPDAPQPQILSATTYGSVVHYALQVMEKAIHEGREDALDLALKTFAYYWHPSHTEELDGVRRVNEWIARQSYDGLLARGKAVIKDWYELTTSDKDSTLLALEYQFAVPMEIDGRLHTLTGTIDRLEIGRYYRKPILRASDYKGLALDTPLPTPTGWTTMGAVQVGDELLGSDGRPVRVTLKSNIHDRPCYEIRFDDTSTIVADNVHLWTVVHGPSGQTVRETVNTDRLCALCALGEVVRIDNASPLELPPVDLPIDPYVLGAWIGDGNRGRGVITKPDQELFDIITSRGHSIGKAQIDPRTGCQTRTILGLQRELRDAGYLGRKAVPSIYLRGSRQQRLDLLRGLMDTDGCWHKTRRRAIFTTTDKALAEAVRELVVSLGWKGTLFTSQRTGFGRTVTAYDLWFTPVVDNPFSLTRKSTLVDTLDRPPTQIAWRRQIKEVRPVPSVPTQCIQVDAANSLYLAGEQMVPTHNTGRQPYGLRWNQQGSAYSWATTLPSFWFGWPESGMGELPTFDRDDVERIENLFASWGFRLHEDSPGDAPLAARKFRWINLQEIKFADGGWRTERDYARLKLAVDGYIRSCEAEAYAVNMSGDKCQWCSFQKTCGGVGLPGIDEGRP